MSSFIPPGMGWIPDLPDARDYTCRHPAVLPLLQGLKQSRRKKLPDEVDLRQDDEGEYFTSPADQGPLNCSSACAVLSLVEYYERRVHGRTFEGSKLFLYKVTRNLMYPNRRVSGDSGADLRTTLKALARFGVPPEEYWPYDVSRFDEEPSAFLYSLAQPPPGLRYFRLDEPNRDGAATWDAVTSFLAAGFPLAFGFPVPSSLTTDPNIPYRGPLDHPRGGQAAVAVGYRLHHYGRNQPALLIRTSWGSQWGSNGYAWLPAAFLRNQHANALWSLVSDKWLESNELTGAC